jgi:hypothetical protein
MMLPQGLTYNTHLPAWISKTCPGITILNSLQMHLDYAKWFSLGVNMNICELPMGLCNSPNIFQEKMSKIMTGLEFFRAYIDDLLVISKDTFENHLDHLEKVLTRLSEAGLKVNATKSFFC